MRVIDVRNVQHALVAGGSLLRVEGDREPSRDGGVLVAPCPVSTVYRRPTERVLLDPLRDANPFFHLMESVWMLAGRRDPQWLDRYVRNFSARFAEEGGEQHGAYGYRWRRHFERESSVPGYREFSDLDQILQVAEMLRRDPTTRRAVLAMWDPVVDLNLPSRDLPCNTHVYFRSRPGDDHDVGPRLLDITVCNRSNDVVMGAYGANAVHMSIMGEVVAGLAGMRLGSYTQVSNNYHGYERDLEKMPTSLHEDLYADGTVAPQLICGEDDDPAAITDEATRVVRDCTAFCETVSQDGGQDHLYEYAGSNWFRDTVIPMQLAHDLWRSDRRQDAINWLLIGDRQQSDWLRAGVEWMQRRMR